MKATGDPDVSPNIRTYDTIIKAVMNSKRSDKEAQLRQLQRDWEGINQTTRAEAKQ
jgi:hypothetical protein